MESHEKARFFYERKQAARQIKSARSLERGTPDEMYNIDRTGKEYLYTMCGLENLFRYVKTLPSRKVLDIGAGNGNAIRTISQMSISKNLDFEITVLQNIPEIEKNFPKDKVHITGVETLSGIKDKSIGCVLGLNSIAYSASPVLAIKRIDEVLVPGGTLKATFNSFGDITSDHGLAYKDGMQFFELLVKSGYDSSIIPQNLFYAKENNHKYPNFVLLAIKPGNQMAPRAEELMQIDMMNVQKDIVEYEDNVPVFSIKDGQSLD